MSQPTGVCGRCRVPLVPGARFCAHCGTPTAFDPDITLPDAAPADLTGPKGDATERVIGGVWLVLGTVLFSLSFVAYGRALVENTLTANVIGQAGDILALVLLAGILTFLGLRLRRLYLSSGPPFELPKRRKRFAIAASIVAALTLLLCAVGHETPVTESAGPVVPPIQYRNVSPPSFPPPIENDRVFPRREAQPAGPQIRPQSAPAPIAPPRPESDGGSADNDVLPPSTYLGGLSKSNGLMLPCGDPVAPGWPTIGASNGARTVCIRGHRFLWLNGRWNPG